MMMMGLRVRIRCVHTVLTGDFDVYNYSTVMHGHGKKTSTIWLAGKDDDKSQELENEWGKAIDAPK